MCNCRRIRLTLFLGFTTLSLPALAAKRVTVEQLQQTLVSARAAHRSDKIVAKQLVGIELATRLSPAGLSQLLDLSPGPEASQALRVMADVSVFLEPSASEIPSKPAPDFTTQKVIIGQAIHYVARTLPNLPNFLAVRRTEHYDDAPQTYDTEEWATRGAFQLRGVSETPIAFRDGRETDDPTLVNAPLASPKKATRGKYANAKLPNVDKPGDHSLSSWGEFGPILGVVLLDAAKGKVSWARWEQSDGKVVGVFNFKVDRAVSHYVVESLEPGVIQKIGSIYGSRGGQTGSADQTKASDAALHRLAAGYHGSLAVDPENGTILRIVIQADLPSEATLQRGDIMVEYGSVRIGEKSYFCPIHSVTASVVRVLYRPTIVSAVVQIPEQRLNDVKFIDYRRFGSETTLITSGSSVAEKGRGEAAIPPDLSATSGDVSPVVTDSSTTAPSPAVSASADPVPVPVAPEPLKETAAVIPPTPAVVPALNIAPEADDEEVLLRSVNGIPGMEESSDEAHTTGGVNQTTVKTATNGAFTLQVTTRLVDIGLVALDKHGKPVTDLKAEEVEVYDNGRRQPLRGFHHTTPNAAEPAKPMQATPATDTFTNAEPVAKESEDVPDTLILMLDESHLAFNDLNRARGEVIRFLNAARPNARIALYAFSEQGFRVIQDATQDHALVVKKLATWRPSIKAISQGQELDKRNNQQIDTVRNVEDLNSVNGNSIEVPDYIHSADPQLRQMGQNPLRASLEGMIAVAQHFAAIPGHRSLAWIAGDSVLADWQDRAVGLDKGPNILDAALRHTREALTEAHIALYAVDATSIEAMGPDSSLENQNVMLNPTSPAYSNPSGAPTRDNSPGRLQSQMQADLHGIQGPVRQLAESTGGRAINRGSDLKSTLDSIEQDSTSLYELTFNPDTAADGKFHTLQLKIPSRKDVKLRYRTGYLYTEESTGNKQRIQQAIWSPQDLTAITLTAEAVNAADSPSGKDTVKLRIGFPGLSFQQKDAGASARWADQLYIFVAERDDASQNATVDGDTLRLSLKQATYDSGMAAGIPYQREIHAKAKLGSIRVIVVDGNSGKMGSVTLPTSAFQP